MKVLSLLFAVLAFASAPIAAQNREAPAYSLEFEISEGGVTVGKPRLTVREGARAIMTVERPNGYSMRVNLERGSNPGTMVVKTELYFQRGGGWQLVGNPQITTPLGQQASIAATMPSGRSAYRLAVTVRQAERLSATGSGVPCDASRHAAWETAMGQPFMLRLASIDTLQQGCCQGPCFTCCGDRGICCTEAHVCIGTCCVQ